MVPAAAAARAMARSASGWASCWNPVGAMITGKGISVPSTVRPRLDPAHVHQVAGPEVEPLVGLAVGAQGDLVVGAAGEVVGGRRREVGTGERLDILQVDRCMIIMVPQGGDDLPDEVVELAGSIQRVTTTRSSDGSTQIMLPPDPSAK